MNTEAIQTLQKLIAIESVAEHGAQGYPYGPGPAKALAFALDLCESWGFKVCRKDEYGYAEIGEGEELIGILSHLDVVPAGEGWTVPPFEGTLAAGPEGMRLYGRGSIDDKGPTVACLYAMKALSDSGTPIRKRIRLILGQTEENGDWKDMEAYREQEELPDYGFTPDGDFPAIYCEKGVMVIRIRMDLAVGGLEEISSGSAANMVPSAAEVVIAGRKFVGSGSPAHGCAPWGGQNAMDDLIRNAGETEDLSRIPFLQMYRDLFAGKIYGEGIDCVLEDSESGKLTVNPGKIRTEEDVITLWLDIRYPITADHETIFRKVSGHVHRYGAVAECVHAMEPVHMDRGGAVMQKLLEAYYDHTDDRSEPISIGGGTYARAMPGIIAYGPNFPGHENREHQSDEYILVEDFMKLIEIYQDALSRLLG